MDDDAAERNRLARADVLGVEGRGGGSGREDVRTQESEDVDAASRQGEGVVDLVVGRANDARADASVRAEEELERRDREGAVRLGDGVITEGGARACRHRERIRIGADVAAGSVAGHGHRLSAEEADDGRRSVGLGRGAVDERRGHSGNRQSSRGDGRGGIDRGRATEGVVGQGGRVAAEGDACEGDRLARADVLGVEGRRARRGGERVAAEQTEHVDATRGRSGGVIDLVVRRADDAGADAAVRAEVQLIRREGQRTVHGGKGIVTEQGVRSCGHAERIRIGPDIPTGSISGDGHGLAADQAGDRRRIVGLSEGIVCQRSVRTGDRERRRGDGCGRGHAGRAAEGIVRQGGRVAMDDDAAERNRLARADVLGVESRRTSGGGQGIAAEEAEDAEATRRRGKRIVGLVVGRADDAGADATIRAEEELERRDREGAVHISDGIIAERSAGARGGTEHIHVGTDVTAGRKAGDDEGFARGEAGDGRSPVVLRGSVIDHRGQRTGDGDSGLGDVRGEAGGLAQGVVAEQRATRGGQGVARDRKRDAVGDILVGEDADRSRREQGDGIAGNDADKLRVGRIDRSGRGAVVGAIHAGDAGDGQRRLGDIGAESGHGVDGVIAQRGAATCHEGGADGRSRDGDAVGDVLIGKESRHTRSGDGDGVPREHARDRGARSVEGGDQGAVIDAIARRKSGDRQGRRGDVRRRGQREVGREAVISQGRGGAHEGDAAEGDRLGCTDMFIRECARVRRGGQGVAGEKHRGDRARGRGRAVIDAAVRRGGDARVAARRRAARDELERRDDKIVVHQGHDVVADVGTGRRVA